MDNRTIRPAQIRDLPAILEIYSWARNFMESYGNGGQWGKTEPKRPMLENDILRGQLYVIEEDTNICGVFAFIIGEDPTYTHIEGSWNHTDKYGTIHRIAGNGKNILASCLAYCRGIIDHLRIDTHEKNLPMRHLIEKNGFSYCGTIYVSDGSPRRAYDWHK